MLIFLTAVYFFFMARKTTLVDTSSRVSEIVEVCSDIFFNFLVVLARVFDMVAPCPPGGVVHLCDAGQQNDFGWGSD